jgi:di/tripeptidase
MELATSSVFRGRQGTTMVNAQRLLRRFLNYVRVDTTARDGQTTYPSSPGQLELGRLLRDELLAIGLVDAVQTDMGIILATVSPSVNRAVNVVALNAHLDTSPETTGANVRSQVVRDYRGGDITLSGNPRAVIRVADNRELTIVRGGTEGSRFTELGLPAPNLSTGEHNPHSPLEWTCLEETVQAVEMLLELVRFGPAKIDVRITPGRTGGQR